MNRLDMTHSDNRGQKLIDEIVKTVADSQSFILTPLPDELFVTERQYLSLVGREDVLMSMVKYNQFTDSIAENSKHQLFRTPHNVMEVRVKGYEDA